LEGWNLNQFPNLWGEKRLEIELVIKVNDFNQLSLGEEAWVNTDEQGNSSTFLIGKHTDIAGG
jgi:hypothetical protein